MILFRDEDDVLDLLRCPAGNRWDDRGRHRFPVGRAVDDSIVFENPLRHRLQFAGGGVIQDVSTPRIPRNSLFGISLPAFGPLPKPLKLMQARRRPSGETASRYGYQAVGMCPST